MRAHGARPYQRHETHQPPTYVKPPLPWLTADSTATVRPLQAAGAGSSGGGGAGREGGSVSGMILSGELPEGLSTLQLYDKVRRGTGSPLGGEGCGEKMVQHNIKAELGVEPTALQSEKSWRRGRSLTCVYGHVLCLPVDSWPP